MATPVEKVKVSLILTEGSAGSKEEMRRAPEHLSDEKPTKFCADTSPKSLVVFWDELVSPIN
jgi:hypothetical protein